MIMDNKPLLDLAKWIIEIWNEGFEGVEMFDIQDKLIELGILQLKTYDDVLNCNPKTCACIEFGLESEEFYCYKLNPVYDNKGNNND